MKLNLNLLKLASKQNYLLSKKSRIIWLRLSHSCMVVENKGMLYQHFLLNFTRKSYQTQESFKVRALVKDEKKWCAMTFSPICSCHKMASKLLLSRWFDKFLVKNINFPVKNCHRPFNLSEGEKRRDWLLFRNLCSQLQTLLIWFMNCRRIIETMNYKLLWSNFWNSILKWVFIARNSYVCW